MIRTGRTTQAQMMNLFWIHDKTGLIYANPIKVIGRDVFEWEWFNCKVKGKAGTFKSSGKSFTVELMHEAYTENAVVAFDGEGRGVVFHRLGKQIYTVQELPNLNLEQLQDSGMFYYNGKAYPGKPLDEIKGLYPQFANRVFPSKGDKVFEIEGTKVEGHMSLRCAGSCTPLIVFTSKGEGLIYY